MLYTILSILSIVFISFIYLLLSLNINKSKKYIINNINNIKYIGNNKFELKGKGYYKEISIRLINDNEYSVIHWADRDSWKWDLKKDFYYNVIYSKNNNKKTININYDLEIIKKLNFIKINEKEL